jgi:hypothetical protein
MTTDKYGPVIEVTITNGQRPDWLADDQVCMICFKGKWFATQKGDFDWNAVTAIRLLAGDPYYKEQVMNEELPPIELLDMAAMAVTAYSWESLPGGTTDWAKRSIIAHARTLQKLAAHDPSIMPIDPDQECLAAAMEAMGYTETARLLRKAPNSCQNAAIAVIKAYREAAVAKALGNG